MKNYFNETRERWGDTSAYHEHQEKTKNYIKKKWSEASDGLMVVFAELAACKENGASVDSSEAQALIAKLQAYITSNFYICTDKILAGLGQMYIDDVHFKKNIDMCGEGTAEFVSEAIANFCQEK